MIFLAFIFLLVAGCGGEAQQFTPQNAPPVIEEPRPAPVVPVQPPEPTPPIAPPPQPPVVPPEPPPPSPLPIITSVTVTAQGLTYAFTGPLAAVRVQTDLNSTVYSVAQTPGGVLARTWQTGETFVCVFGRDANGVENQKESDYQCRPTPPPPVSRALLPPWFVYCDVPPCLVYSVDGNPIQVTGFNNGGPVQQVPMNFLTTTLIAPTVTTVFFEHPDIPNAATVLHETMIAIIDTQRGITGTTSERVTAFFMPTELAFLGEGNISFGNGTITMNYSNVAFIAAMGGILPTVVPRAAHEYAHELFNELVGSFAGDFRCLNEGVADALAYVSGFLPLNEFGPIGLRQISFEGGCDVLTVIHDIGNCYFWHLHKASVLTPAFLNRFFHPTRHYTFNSCDPTSVNTGQNLFALFTEAAGGADLNQAFVRMRVPH